MKKVIFSLLLICITVGTANAQWWQNSKKIKGNGEMTSITRTVSDYDKVGLTGSMDVRLVAGQEGNIQIEAEENLMDYIVTESKGGRLEISVKKGYNLQPSENNQIMITVPFIDLDAVHLTGSGDITSSDVISSENFETKVTGSGDIRLRVKSKNARASVTGSGDIGLSGSAQDFDCNVTGSGDISAFDFQCERVNATVTGSGDITVYASEELKASVPGSGDIKYKGNPKKEDFKSFGSGSISKQ
jgi:hypothetical protein